MLTQNRPSAIHDRLQALGTLALRQMRSDWLAGDIVRGRQTGSDWSAMPNHQMAIADTTMEFDSVTA
jgi:hypothetical protein